MKGAPTAKVAIIEYSDFVCPFCGTFARDTLPELTRTYVDTGKVLLVFRHLPLEAIHPTALKAAQVVECAGHGAEFWEMHNYLFAAPRQLDTSSLTNHAETLGLSPARFAACLDQGQAIGKIRKDAADALAAGVRKTPTFFLGAVEIDGRVKVARRLSGARPFAVFAGILAELLGEPSPVTQAR